MREHEESFRKAREQDLRDHGMSDQPVSIEGGAYIIPQIGVPMSPHQGLSATESFNQVKRAFEEGRYRVVRSETQEAPPEESK